MIIKTKIIPFDLETAKDIQDGKIKGKIKTKCGNEVRILCFDLIDPKDVSFPIVCALYSDTNVGVVRFTKCGRYSGAINSELDLVLEVPDSESQFKPFDKVLVRDCERGHLWWTPAIFQETDDSSAPYMASGLWWKECIPYEGNEYLLGTTEKPKEE